MKWKSLLLVIVLVLNFLSVSVEIFAEPSEIKGGYLDDFESYISDDIFTRSIIWDYRTNTDTTTMCISSDASENKYLDLTSVSGKDTLLMTKNNLFNTNGSTTVKFSIKSQIATKETTCAKVYINNVLLLKAAWGALYLAGDVKVTTAYSSWNDVSVVVDYVNGKATVTSGGKSSEVDISGISNPFIRVQAVGANTVSLDNFMIADSFYYGDVYAINHDFEEFTAGNISGQLPTNLNISQEACTNIYYDDVTDNKYIKLEPTASKADPIIYTASKITSERTILEYDFKMDNPDGQFAVYIRLSNGTKQYLMRYNMGTFTLLWNNKPTTIDVCGKDFVKFKFCISNTGNTSVFVNGKYITYYNYNTDVTGTDIRFHSNYGTTRPSDLTSSSASLDNIKMYTPPAPEIRSVIENGATNVACSDYIELEMNNPVNTSTFAKANFLLNGSSDLISSCNSSVKPYRIYVDGGLKPNTTYTLSVVNNKVKDFYDQYINDYSLTFTTGATSFNIDDRKYEVYNAEDGSRILFASYSGNNLLDVKIVDVKGCMSGKIIDTGLDTAYADKMKVYFWGKDINPLNDIFETEITHGNVIYTYPGYVQKAVTFSYDDLIADNDEQLMSIFSEHGIKATFNLITNKFSGDNATISVDDAKNLYKGFDVISHSYSHPVMTQPDFDGVIYEFEKSQEDMTLLCGSEPIGFVWPYSKPNRSDYDDIMQYVKENTAIKYIRPSTTTGNFSIPSDWYHWEPSCHHDELPQMLPAFLNEKAGNNLLLLSVWGHSYEFERASDEVKLRWNDIENFAKQIGENENLWKADNTDIYNYLSAIQKCKEDNAESDEFLVNNTDVDIYAIIEGEETVIPAKGKVPLRKQIVACWGDSLTYGQGSSNWKKASYPAVLQSMLPDFDIRNMGVGGETSMTIAARQGAVDIKLTEDVTIPATETPVDISFSAYNKDGSYAGVVTPRDTSLGGWLPLKISGVKGNLAVSIADTWPRTLESASFTRLGSGVETSIAAGTVLYPDSLSTAKEADINIIFTGTNGGWNSKNTTPSDSNAADLVAITDKMISNTKNPDKYIVIGLTIGDSDDWTKTNQALQTAYGDKFLDIKSYLASAKALEDAEVEVTQSDLESISAGKIPASLLASDGTHFNDAGYRLFAIKVYEKMHQLGYTF